MSRKRRRRTAINAQRVETAPAPGAAPDHAPGAQEEAETEAQPKRTSVLSSVGLIALIVVAVVIFIAVSDRVTGRDEGGIADVPGVMKFDYAGGDHTHDDVAYPELPPVGGPHDDVWQNCGFYTAAVSEERAVHSLEHGAVWITYRPDLEPSQIAALEATAALLDHVLISPYPGLDAPVVASAWNHQLQLDSATDTRLSEFIRAFRLSFSAPEPGAPCTGGSTGTVGSE